MKVVYYHRRPHTGQFSIERLFDDIRRGLPHSIQAGIVTSRFPSRGLLARAYNILEALPRQGDINHITGDIHFVGYLLSRRKTVLTIHDCVSLQRLRGWRYSLFKTLWYDIPITRAGLVTVISESSKQQLLRHVRVNPEKIRVVHNCVADHFLPAPKPFDTESPVVLQVGTGPNKNLERIAEALQSLPCRLNIIGRLSSKQHALLQRHRVRYTNSFDLSDSEVVEQYRECDLLIFASTYEGFGLPILEANATGRPVITSNVLSMPEVAGQAACFVDPYSTASIRSALERIRTDSALREKLVTAGFENRERFRPHAIAAHYVRLYNELLGC